MKRALLLSSLSLSSAALVACVGDSAEPAQPCLDCGLIQPAGGVRENQIAVENDTDHTVALVVRDVSQPTVDRKVIEGSVSVPIAPASRGVERQFPSPSEASRYSPTR